MYLEENAGKSLNFILNLSELNVKRMNYISDRHLLKLTSKKKTKIYNIKRSPEFYHVGGTCCWKVFANTMHRGQGEILRAGSDRRKNIFTIKSVKLHECE